MKTSAIQKHEVSFESKQAKLVNASKQFKKYYFAKPQYLAEFNSNTRALRYPGVKDDLTKYVPASEILDGLHGKVLQLLINPVAAKKVKVDLNQVSSSTFITVRKKGLLRKLGLGKRLETSMLEKTPEGKSTLIPLTQDSLAERIARAIEEYFKK